MTEEIDFSELDFTPLDFDFTPLDFDMPDLNFDIDELLSTAQQHRKARHKNERLHVRVDGAFAAQLEYLTANWHVGKSEAVRRAVALCAKETPLTVHPAE